jgi:cytoskeletal protein RodZ
MSRISQSGLAAQKTPAPVPTGAKHFDTFETKFFEQGEAGDGERFDDLDDAHDATRRSPSRSFLLGMAVGSISVALLGGVVLWLTGAHFGTQAPEASAPIVAPAEPAIPAPAPTPAVPVASPPAPAVAAAEPEPAPQPLAVNAEPAPAPAAAPAAAVAPPAPTAAAAPAAAATEKPAPSAAPAAAEKPVPAEAPVEKPTPAAAGLGLAPAPVVAKTDAALAGCQKAIAGKRAKEILAVCPAAFAAEPTADIAVALAKIELDRGRSARSLEWGKKAVAIDGNAADAYVFIGGGEQMAGHDKAAKDAYRRYLELAPTGRYARDIRGIVGSAK